MTVESPEPVFCGFAMTPEEFMKAVAPDLPTRYQASKLEPHRAAIEKLRSADYSLRQICMYLEHCGVNVTHQMVSKFLRGPDAPPRKAKAGDKARPPSPAPEPAAATPDAPASATHKTREQLAAENPAMRSKEIEERYVDQFASVQQNPLLRRKKSS